MQMTDVITIMTSLRRYNKTNSSCNVVCWGASRVTQTGVAEVEKAWSMSCVPQKKRYKS